MSGTRILERFRPIGAPGAGIVGVPDDTDRAADELAPVFAALRPDLDAARDTLDHAKRASEALLADAREQASRLVEDAEAGAPSVRAAAAAGVQAVAAAADAEILESAGSRAARLHARSSTTDDPAVQEITESILRFVLGSAA
ncbi:hypothetical protein [Leifsonia sp. EB34]|uniref:hypothetical protein n=1 Tax=Leifsonia sp. EB34 TaxID=3156303 RepID=UPI0035123F0B